MIDTPAEIIIVMVILGLFLIPTIASWGKSIHDARPYQDKEESK